MAKLIGAAIFGQSGGPSSVINSSAAGVFQTALNEDCITKVYGAAHGIKGHSHLTGRAFHHHQFSLRNRLGSLTAEGEQHQMHAKEKSCCRSHDSFLAPQSKAKLIEPIVLRYNLQADSQHAQREQDQKKREKK